MGNDLAKAAAWWTKIDRFSDKVAVILFSTVVSYGGFLIVNTWRAAEKFKQIEQALKDYSDDSASRSEARTAAKLDNYQREIKDDLSDVKSSISELRADIREIRVEVIRRAKR